MLKVVRKIKEAMLRRKGVLSYYTKTDSNEVYVYILFHKNSNLVTCYNSDFKVIVEDKDLVESYYFDHGDGHITFKRMHDEKIDNRKICDFYIYSYEGVKRAFVPDVYEDSICLLSDLSYGRIIRKLYGRVYYASGPNGKYIITYDGNVYRNISEYKVEFNKLIIKYNTGKIQVISDEADEICDYTKVVTSYRHPHDAGVFIGKRTENGVIFNFMSFSGRVNKDVEFTRYILFDDYILVSRRNEKEKEDGVKYSLLSLYNGECFDINIPKVFMFSDVVNDRIFVESHFEENGDEDHSYLGKVFMLDLTRDEEDCVVKELKQVAENFVELKFGTFSQYLALVVTKEGKPCYIDFEGNEFPLTGKERIKPDADACSIGYFDLRNIYTVDYCEIADNDDYE